MSTLSQFTKKVVSNPELAQINFEVAVLDKYLAQSDAKISRTRSVGRLKTATWSLDFGIALLRSSVVMLELEIMLNSAYRDTQLRVTILRKRS